jgi:predicted RNA-binding protein with PIN domain
VIIFIDGYNLLKSLRGDEIAEPERDHFIRQLRRYASKRGHTIVLVFDAGPLRTVSSESHGAVKVIYSGKYTADEILIAEVERTPKDQVLVVTDDRAVCAVVSGIDCVSMGVREFYGYLLAALRERTDMVVRKHAVVKTSKTTNTELDELMQSASAKVMQKQEDYARVDMLHKMGQKESKIERRLLQILRKL